MLTLGNFGKFLHLQKMPVDTKTMDLSYNLTLNQMKEEFDEKFNENQPSDSSEKLKEYKFEAILGQGAFGLVVIYHSSF